MKNIIVQFIKFGFVGGLCFLIDYGLMVLLTEVFSVPYLVSCAISFSVSVVVNYLLSMKYVFASREDLSKRREFVIFVALSVVGLLLTELLMWAFTDGLGLFYLLSKAIAAVIVLLWNFFAKKLMYRKKPNKE